jgi:hypothetical protein
LGFSVGGLIPSRRATTTTTTSPLAHTKKQQHSFFRINNSKVAIDLATPIAPRARASLAWQRAPLRRRGTAAQQYTAVFDTGRRARRVVEVEANLEIHAFPDEAN